MQQVDRSWTRHIDKMSKLREAIYLRSYANTNPLQAYTNEGYDMFEKMRTTISIDSIKMLLKVQIRRRTPEEIEQIRKAQEEARMKAEAEKLAAQKVAEEAKDLKKVAEFLLQTLQDQFLKMLDKKIFHLGVCLR